MSYLFLVITLYYSASCYSGSSEGLVTSITSYQHLIFFTSGSHIGQPTCNSQYSGGPGWAFNTYNINGKNLYAMLLAAQAGGRSISVTGSGACQDWFSLETPYSIEIH